MRVQSYEEDGTIEIKKAKPVEPLNLNLDLVLLVGLVAESGM